MQRTIYIFSFLFIFLIAYAQSPPELTAAIDYDSNPTVAGDQFDRVSVAGISAGYDNGRRNEELQFNIPTNSLGSINMPSQIDWDAWSPAEKILHLINEERTARAGVDYMDGVGPVKGLPITGVEQNLSDIAFTYAQSFTINSPSFSDLLDSDPELGGNDCVLGTNPPMNCCHDLLAPNKMSTSANGFVNSIKGFKITDNTVNGMPFAGIEVRVVYNFIYRFPNRLGVLIQDEDLNSSTGSIYGYGDDYGDMGDEGFMGVGIYSGPSPNGNMADSTYVVLTFMDPVPESEDCNYNCITCTPCPNTIVENSNPIMSDVYQANVWVQSAGTVPTGGNVTMKADNFVQLNQSFEVTQGGTFHAYIDDCYFTLD